MSLSSILESFKKFFSVKRNLILTILGILILFLFIIFRPSDKFQILHPKIGPIVEAIYAIGTVKSKNTFEVKLGISGFINEIYVKEGQIVSKGDKLLSTDSTVFTSNIDGTVTEIRGDRKETVMPGIPILTVRDLKNRYVELSLDQNSVLRVKKGQLVELSFETIRGKLLKGKVDSIYPSDGQFIVRVEVEEFPEGIIPDMTADVAIQISRKENVLLVPLPAVKKGKITIKRGFRKETRDLEIGAIDSEWAEVLGKTDIVPEDEIIVEKK